MNHGDLRTPRTSVVGVCQTTSIVYARYICHGYEVDASYACFFDGEGTVQNCSEILP